MEDIQLFNFNSHEVRVVMDEKGDPWFVASDITKILGYSNGRKAIGDHCKSDGVTKRYTIDSMNRQQESSVINEPNLYRLIIKSEMEEAEPFEKWVFEEVLPSIRKHGGYLTKQKTEDLLTDPDLLIQLATALKSERSEKARLQSEFNQLQFKTDHQESALRIAIPKAEFYDHHISSVDNLTVTQIAKELGMTAIQFNLWLKKERVQYKQGDQWHLTSGYCRNGYTATEMYNYLDRNGDRRSKPQTVWTPKGRIFVRELYLEEKNKNTNKFSSRQTSLRGNQI